MAGIIGRNAWRGGQAIFSIQPALNLMLSIMITHLSKLRILSPFGELVRFYHCKGQDRGSPRCQINDVYEVNGKAAKSVHWGNRKRMLKQLVERANRNGTAAKLRKGTIVEIESIL